MSTYAIILTGLMIGSGPERVSDEIEQGLNLSGEWEGVWQTQRSSREVTLRDGKLHWAGCLVGEPPDRYEYSLHVVEEGRGNLRIRLSNRHLGVYRCLAIYHQKGDRLLICFRAVAKGRPVGFSVNEGQRLLILHRVKPGK